MRHKRSKSGPLFRIFFYASLIGLLSPDYARPQGTFYEGKTITVVAGTEPGGSGDMRARGVVSVLKKYIPGSPTIIMEYMPGGGGRKAGNYIYRTARPDGLTIGSMLTGFVSGAVLGEAGVLYDIDKMIYLGSLGLHTPYVFVSRKGAGLSTLERLRAAPGVRIGAPSVGHTIYVGGRVFAYLLDMKGPKFVTGYAPAEIDLALERGEVDTRAQVTDTIIQRTPHWIERNLVDFHAVLEVPKGRKHPHPSFAKLPDLENFARSERDRSLVGIYRAFRMIGMPLVLPPGTPKDRVQILEEAMRRTFRDPEFYKEYKRLGGEEATPLMPEELEKAIKDLPREPDVIDLFKKLSGPDPLPPR
jgi:tripartite-type tricarboxylate transporter receptor subunit TctC